MDFYDHDFNEDKSGDFDDDFGDDFGQFKSSKPSFKRVLFRDVSYKPRPSVILNPRDDRFFPGNEPAGVAGITPTLLRFITLHVNQVSFYVQGPPPPPEKEHDEFDLDLGLFP